MTDSAEMGERPGDPATRAGIGVGAEPDDYSDGAAEAQFESEYDGGARNNGTAVSQDDGGTPGEAQVPFADTDALASGMQPVDSWGVGDREQPQESPAEELGNDT
jgi:hypothetical protein